MISAYDLLKGLFTKLAVDQHLCPRLYEQMVKLGDILTCAFNPPLGVPRNWLDPATCATEEGTPNTLAGAGTMILGFARFSGITGNPIFAEMAKKAQKYLLNPSSNENEPHPGLLGSYVQVSDGGIVSSKGGWGSLSDSFYEYLIKVYVHDRRT